MPDPQQLAESVGEVRSRVTAVAPYSMLRQAGVHGTISLIEGADRIICEVCSEQITYGLNYIAMIGALEDHLLETHGDFGSEIVVAVQAGLTGIWAAQAPSFRAG